VHRADGRAEARAGASATAVRWRELGRGMAVGPALSVPVAFVALDRAATRRFAYRLPANGKTALARLDYGRNAVVAIFSQFGCKDHRVAVTSLAQRKSATLVVSLDERPQDPGTMECQAIYPTYRLLAVPKASLTRPYPTRSEARLS
jgi:hypothetical protein